jgi:hypothetical protein
MIKPVRDKFVLGLGAAANDFNGRKFRARDAQCRDASGVIARCCNPGGEAV